MAAAESGTAGFGIQLRHWRLAAGLTQEALAERAGVSAKAVSELERDLDRTPRLETVTLLADALELDAAGRASFLAAARPDPEPPAAPLHPTPARRTLPRPLTSLFGRAGVTAAVAELMRRGDVPLLTLTGPGGVGKTRLALRVAEEIEQSFANGVALVELAPVRDPALAPSALAAALGVPDRGSRALRESLISALGERELLLVLDNCEHILAAAPFVADLLRHCPRLRVLATSRAPLGLAGERLWVVAPLALPLEDEPGPDFGPAVRLFAARAQAVAPDFRLIEDNAATVVAICRHLDGLPLAIELAAARTRLLPPEALLARLDHRLPLLTGGSRDLPARQSTMRDAIAWSYDLLGPAEQQLLQRLAVFAGGFTLEAAEAVAPPDVPEPLAALQALLDHSLVTRDPGDGEAPPSGGGGLGGETRFGMLETIREYALERLAENGEEAAARHAHAAWCLAFAERFAPDFWRDHDVLERAGAIAAEHSNMLAALDHLAASGADETQLRLAVSLGHFWYLCSWHSVGRAFLERALVRPTALPAAEAVALADLGFLATLQGDFAAAVAPLARAEERANDSGDLLALAVLRTRQSALATFAGDYATGKSRATEAVALASAGNDPRVAAFARWLLARAIQYGGDPAHAEMIYQELLSDRSAPPYAIAAYQYSLGIVTRNRGQHATALALFAAALPFFRELDELWSVATCLEGIAMALGELGRTEVATDLFGAAAELRATTGDQMLPADHADYERALAVVRDDLGDAAFAAAWEAGRALTVAEAVVAAEAAGAALGASEEAHVGANART